MAIFFTLYYAVVFFLYLYEVLGPGREDIIYEISNYYCYYYCCSLAYFMDTFFPTQSRPFWCQSDLHNVPRDRLTAHVELTRVNSTCLARISST